MKINKEQAREHIEVEVADTAENSTIAHEGMVGNGQDETKAIALISSFRSQILLWLKLFPE